MKKIITLVLATVVLIAITFCSSCVYHDNGSTPENQDRSAIFKVDGSAKTVEKPYNSIFDNNDTIINTATLSANDGSKIKLVFEGMSLKPRPLNGFPDAVYTDPQGKNYNAVRGELNVNRYSIARSIYSFSGTFNFVAKSLTNPSDSVVITEGIITNCSNEL